MKSLELEPLDGCVQKTIDSLVDSNQHKYKYDDIIGTKST